MRKVQQMDPSSEIGCKLSSNRINLKITEFNCTVFVILLFFSPTPPYHIITCSARLNLLKNNQKRHSWRSGPLVAVLLRETECVCRAALLSPHRCVPKLASDAFPTRAEEKRVAQCYSRHLNQPSIQ